MGGYLRDIECLRMKFVNSTKNGFNGDLLSGTIGTVIAYMLGFLLLPLVTRFYKPEHIGAWQIIFGFIALLVPLATLRFESALVLEKSIKISKILLSVILINTIFIVTSLLFMFFFIGSEKTLILNLEINQDLFLFSAIGIFLQSIFFVFNALIIKHKKFKIQAVGKILRSLSIPIIALFSLLVVDANNTSYIIAGLLAIMMQGLFLFYFLDKKYFKDLFLLKKSEMKKAIIKYKVYPLYMVPYALSQGAIWQITLVSLGALFSASTIGAYTIAKQLVYMPVSLLSTGLRPVIFSYASSAPRYDNEINDYIYKLLINIINISIPFGVFAFFYLPDIINFMLGEGWEEAGEFSRWILISAILAMQTSWLDRMLDVYGRQKLAFLFQVSSDIGLLLILFLCYLFDASSLITIMSMSIFLAVSEFIWLVMMLNILRFKIHVLFNIFFRIAIVTVVLSSLMWLISYFFEKNYALIIEILILSISSFFVYFQIKKDFSNN